MRKILFVLLAVLIACSPPQPVTTPAPEQHEAVVETQEVVTQPPQPAPEIAPTPSQETELEINPYTELGCEQLLTSEQFAAECGKTADDYIVTYKVGTRNCFVNIKDKQNDRLTAGVTLTGFANEEVATKEFDRRLVVLKVGADKSVGERAYTMTKVDRETVNFLREEFLVEVGADTRLCDKESITTLARAVDTHLD